MVGMIMDAVLMLLLVAAVGYGVKLERKLTALRAGQLAFASAVTELNSAASRAEAALGSEALTDTVARSLFKLMAYKDEYEVARLHMRTGFLDELRLEFDGDFTVQYHLAPPFLPGRTPEGRPQKRDFGAWMLPLFRGLAAMRGLRGTPLDVFGWQGERRRERALAAQYERDMAELLPKVTPATLETARELAALPQQIRGYGFIKDAAAEAAAARRAELLAAFRAGGWPEEGRRAA